MARPGLVLEVDERTPPLLVSDGEQLHLERFPLGTRVVYAPDSLRGLRDVNAAIQHALLHPLGTDPLPEQLFAGMKLTIAFDDLSLPLPPMTEPDVRALIIEQVLELAATKGVDDVELIAANSLHRRMTAAEIKHIVGERVFASFWPDKLTNHDAEDRDNLAHLGTTSRDEEVEINRRAAESDLLVYVNITSTAMSGGSKSVVVGLGSYRSLRHHHNVHTLQHSRSFMDPPSSAMHHSYDRMSALLAEHVKVFTIETTLNNAASPDTIRFLTTREWEWSLRDQAGYLAFQRLTDRAPARIRRALLHRQRAPYGITGVNAGDPSQVHPRTLSNIHRQQLTEISGQSDILVLGIPYICPYNVNSIMNPILVQCLALGYFFNLYKGCPVVRAGGVLIFYHQLRAEFHPVHHPSYIDFYEEVLVSTIDPAAIETKFEEQYATDPWYIHLYRNSYAYHGVHPLYMWYWGAHAREHLGEVIAVGASRAAAARLGFRAASSLPDALEMARDRVGGSPSITYLHLPPLVMAEVR
jgi:lactate racemase